MLLYVWRHKNRKPAAVGSQFTSHFDGSSSLTERSNKKEMTVQTVLVFGLRLTHRMFTLLMLKSSSNPLLTVLSSSFHLSLHDLQAARPLDPISQWDFHQNTQSKCTQPAASIQRNCLKTTIHIWKRDGYRFFFFLIPVPIPNPKMIYFTDLSYVLTSLSLYLGWNPTMSRKSNGSSSGHRKSSMREGTLDNWPY